MEISLDQQKLDYESLLHIFEYLNDSFNPILSSQVNLLEYSRKLAQKADFILLKNNRKVIGVIAFYINDNKSFITSIGIHKSYHGKGLGVKLFGKYLSILENNKISKIELEVHKINFSAISFYEKFGFSKINLNKNKYLCTKLIDYPNEQ